MSLNYFLKVPEVPGEATAITHANEIEVLSFSWGVANAASPRPGTGPGRGKLELSDLTILKTTDRASAPLMTLAAFGKVITEDVVLAGEGAGSSFGNVRPLVPSLDVVRYILRGAMITSVSVSGSTGGDDRPIESISIAYTSLRFEYRVDGQLVNFAELTANRPR